MRDMSAHRAAMKIREAATPAHMVALEETMVEKAKASRHRAIVEPHGDLGARIAEGDWVPGPRWAWDPKLRAKVDVWLAPRERTIWYGVMATRTHQPEDRVRLHLAASLEMAEAWLRQWGCVPKAYEGWTEPADWLRVVDAHAEAFSVHELGPGGRALVVRAVMPDGTVIDSLRRGSSLQAAAREVGIAILQRILPPAAQDPII